MHVSRICPLLSITTTHALLALPTQPRLNFHVAFLKDTITSHLLPPQIPAMVVHLQKEVKALDDMDSTYLCF